jgi:Cytochrome c554 and c-prime
MATRETGDTRKRKRWTHCIAVGLPVAVCAIAMLLLNISAVRAMQDEHAEAPRSTRQLGATVTNMYAGQAKCLTCHGGRSSQPSTGMGMAALNPSAANSLDYSSMSYRNGPYTVTMRKGQGGLQMTASDDKGSVTIPVRWIFGQGYAGQTFILEQDGRFYESRASYYKAISNLDLTIGHTNRPPVSPLAALGRPLPAEEVKKCFSCHMSEDIVDGKLDVNQAHPGVTCENCHGAGSEHASKMAGAHTGTDGKDDTIFNPEMLAPADLNDFCGSCHRTTRDVLDSGIRDIRNVRFQPYRLENSRCYDPSDERITCVACHDPHRKLQTSAIEYDGKCLACHLRRGDKPDRQKAAACPRATGNCVTCHMRKLDLPGAHFAFTDHYIRVVQPNMPYPD